MKRALTLAIALVVVSAAAWVGWRLFEDSEWNLEEEGGSYSLIGDDEVVTTHRARYTVKKWGVHAGLRHGYYESRWAEGGGLRERAVLDNGKVTGVVTLWNKDGSVWEQARYRDGVKKDERAEPPWWPDCLGNPVGELSVGTGR